MKNFVKLFSIIGVGLCLVGCERIENIVSRVADKDTLKAVDQCVESNKSELVSEVATRNQCAKSWSIEFSERPPNLKGEPDRGNKDEVTFVVTGKNESNHLVTSLEIRFEFLRKDGAVSKWETVFGVIEDLWVTPGETINASYVFTTPFWSDIQACQRQEAEKGGTCWAWKVTRLKGLGLVGL